VAPRSARGKAEADGTVKKKLAMSNGTHPCASHLSLLILMINGKTIVSIKIIKHIPDNKKNMMVIIQIILLKYQVVREISLYSSS
jgi:hypothetical protein